MIQGVTSGLCLAVERGLTTRRTNTVTAQCNNLEHTKAGFPPAASQCCAMPAAKQPVEIRLKWNPIGLPFGLSTEFN